MSEPVAVENVARSSTPVAKNVKTGGMPHIENPYLRQSLAKGEVHWRQDITGAKKREAVDTTEKGMPPQDQRDFIKIIFERYKKVSEHYVSPQQGEKAPVRQQLDDWAEWIIKEIAAENDISEFPENGSEALMVEYLEGHLNEMSLDRLHDDTRNAAYFVVVGTEIEMMASAAVAGRNVANIKKNFLDTARYAAQELYAKVVTSDRVLDTIAFFDPTLSQPEFRSRWKEMRRRAHVTAYDPVSKGYDSAYMKAIGFDGWTPQQRHETLAQTERLRAQFAHVSTGIDVHSPLWDQINGIIKRPDSPRYQKSLDPRQNLYVGMLSDVLRHEYENIRFETLPIEKRTPVLLEAATRSIARAAREQANGILHRTAENAFSKENLTKMDEAFKAIKTEDVKDKVKEAEVEILNRRIGEVTTTQTDWKSKYQSVQRIRQENVGKNTRLTGEKAKKATERAHAVTEESAAPAGRDKLAWADAIAKIDAAVTQIDTEVATIPTATTPIPEEDALELATNEVLAKLTGFADATTIAAIYNTGPPPTINESELTKFVTLQKGELSKIQDQARLAAEKLRQKAEWVKATGPKVLTVIKEESNTIVADFVQGRQGRIASWEEFAEKLHLEQALNEEVRVLTPDRLAKLLVTYMEIEGIDPNDIKNPLITKIPDVGAPGGMRDLTPVELTRRKKEFNDQWTKIMRKFWALDGFGRGKVVLEIYGDRFNAMLKKTDPSADMIRYKRADASHELMERQMEPEMFIEALEREGIHMGVDAVVDAVGDHVLVGRNGEVTVYQVEELQDNERALKFVAPLGIDLIGGVVEITNPTLPPETIQSLFNEFGARDVIEQMMGLPLGNRINLVGLDGRNRRVRRIGTRLQDVVVESGPEVTATGAPIPISRFADYSNQLDDVFKDRGGKRIINKIDDASNNLDTLVKLKKGGFIDNENKKPVDIDPNKVPDEIAWVDGTNSNKEYVIILNDPTNIFIESRERTSATDPYKATLYFTGTASNPNRQRIENWLGFTVDPMKILKKQIGASAYDLLLRMSPDQRQMLSFTPVAVDMNIRGVVDGRVSISIDDEGQIMGRDARGRQWLLSELLDRAVMSNRAGGLPQYDIVNPANATDVDTQPNLKIQSEIGVEVLRRLHNLKQLQ